MIHWAADSDPNSMTTGFPADGADPADGRLDFDETAFRGWMIDSGWAAVPRPGPTKSNDVETAVKSDFISPRVNILSRQVRMMV